MLLAKAAMCFVVIFHACLAEEVIELEDEDFEDNLNEYNPLLVMFYAPWCGHCKKLKPEFRAAAKVLAQHDPPVYLARIDCTEDGKETCEKYNIGGYPSLKIFKEGAFEKNYGGSHETSAEIVKYMKNQVGPSSKEVKTLQELDDIIKAEPEVIVIGFFKADSPLQASFSKIADKRREKVRFAHTSSEEILQNKGYTNDVVLYRPEHLHNKFEENFVEFKGDAVKLNTFITKNYHGIVGHRTTHNMDEFKNPLITAYYRVDYIKNIKGSNYWRNRILKVAQPFYGKIAFAVSSNKDFKSELDEYDQKVVDEKPIICARDSKNQKFVMKGPFTMEAFEQFIKDMLARKLEPFVKSEPIPKDGKGAKGTVKVAVAKNFDDVVLNNGKDTMLEFYAPWCGHCKKLAPIYEKLAAKMADEDIEIMKIDHTANDIPGTLFNVGGYPSLYWINKEIPPRVYDGGRELNDFIKYIAKHSTKELKGWDRKGRPRKGKQKKTEL